MTDFSTWSRQNLEALCDDLSTSNKVMLAEWRETVKQRPSAVNENHTLGAAVDQGYFWQPMSTCPRGVKVQLLNAGGVAVYGQHASGTHQWLGWAPLPNKPEWMKR